MNNARKLWHALGELADFITDLVRHGRQRLELPVADEPALEHETNGERRRLPAARK